LREDARLGDRPGADRAAVRTGRRSLHRAEALRRARRVHYWDAQRRHVARLEEESLRHHRIDADPRRLRARAGIRVCALTGTYPAGAAIQMG
jgi:hypothetical protein